MKTLYLLMNGDELFSSHDKEQDAIHAYGYYKRDCPGLRLVRKNANPDYKADYEARTKRTMPELTWKCTTYPYQVERGFVHCYVGNTALQCDTPTKHDAAHYVLGYHSHLSFLAQFELIRELGGIVPLVQFTDNSEEIVQVYIKSAKLAGSCAVKADWPELKGVNPNSVYGKPGDVSMAYCTRDNKPIADPDTLVTGRGLLWQNEKQYSCIRGQTRSIIIDWLDKNKYENSSYWEGCRINLIRVMDKVVTPPMDIGPYIRIQNEIATLTKTPKYGDYIAYSSGFARKY